MQLTDNNIMRLNNKQVDRNFGWCSILRFIIIIMTYDAPIIRTILKSAEQVYGYKHRYRAPGDEIVFKKSLRIRSMNYERRSRRNNRVKRRSLNNVISHRQYRCMRMREPNKNQCHPKSSSGLPSISGL